MNKYSIAGLLLIFVILEACRPAQPVPKPRGYFKVELPQKRYTTFERDDFPYRFEYPVYGRITQDTQLIAEEQSPYWINIEFKDLDAALYLSYKPITAQQPFHKLVEESYKLSYAHDVRADYIKTPEFRTPNHLVGVFYHVAEMQLPLTSSSSRIPSGISFAAPYISIQRLMQIP